MARPLSEADGPVKPVQVDTVVAKIADVDTARLYVAAPVTVPHVRLGEVDAFAVPLVGVARAGATGDAIIVVNCQIPDQALVPALFVAFTSQ